jgi:hypothetical protein
MFVCLFVFFFKKKAPILSCHMHLRHTKPRKLWMQMVAWAAWKPLSHTPRSPAVRYSRTSSVLAHSRDSRQLQCGGRNPRTGGHPERIGSGRWARELALQGTVIAGMRDGATATGTQCGGCRVATSRWMPTAGWVGPWGLASAYRGNTRARRAVGIVQIRRRAASGRRSRRRPGDRDGARCHRRETRPGDAVRQSITS